MKKILRTVMMGLAGAVFLTACTRDEIPAKAKDPLPNTLILDWNLVALEAAGGINYQLPLQGSRINAMVHIAMHDALNAIDPVYEQYAFKGDNRKASLEAAAAAAAHGVLSASFPEKRKMLDSMLSVSLKSVGNSEKKDAGLEIGKAAAAAILALRADDAANADPVGPVAETEMPGMYRPVPPFNFLFAPQWKTMKLFALEKHDQFLPPPPPALNSAEYANAFNEVKRIGRAHSESRTAAQSAYAKFWYEFSEIGWNRVARIGVKNKDLGLMATARVFALLNMALADSYSSGWHSKYHYNFWRPYSAIRLADTDGNELTDSDINWEPAEPTPPAQDYPSTHSVLGNAGATVLSELLGNNMPFVMNSSTAVDKTSYRQFNNFLDAANENADSRVMAGIHFRFASEAGQKMGNKIGEWVVNNYCRPAK